MRRLTYRTVFRLLVEHDPGFGENVLRGKGSHRTFFHDDIDGQRRAYTLGYHGEKTPVPPRALREIIRRFNLPEDFFD